MSAPAVTFSPDIAPDTLTAFEDQARMPAGLFFERMIAVLADGKIISAKPSFVSRFLIGLTIICFALLSPVWVLGLGVSDQGGSAADRAVFLGVSLAALFAFLKFDPVRDGIGNPRYVLGPVGLMLLHYLTTSPTL